MRIAIGLTLAAVLLAGCSSTSSVFGGGGSTASSAPAAEAADRPNFGDRVMDFLYTGKSNEHPAANSGAAQNDIECPFVTVREGASTWAVNDPGEPSPLTLRYQGDVGRLARDCHLVGNTLVMKVGMEGRIILGPKGAPGKIDVPIRFAVVHEGPIPQTILTRSYRKEVTIEPGSGNVSFTQVDDNISFPMPAVRSDLENYVVYVGFDPQALKPPVRKPARHKTRKPKPARTSGL